MNQFAEDAQLLAESRGLKMVLAQNDGGASTFDPGWMRQVLFNRLSNALRFSPPKGTIIFSSKCTDGEWTVEAWDEGQGVPPDRLNDSFERFVQITPRMGFGFAKSLAFLFIMTTITNHTIQSAIRINHIQSLCRS